MSIYSNIPAQHPEDWASIGPVGSGLHPMEKWYNQGVQRRLRGDRFSEMEIEDREDISDSMLPYMAERISIETGEHILSPLSLNWANDMGTNKEYKAGYMSKNIGSQQSVALSIFAGRDALKDTELAWAGLSEEKRNGLTKYLGWSSGINILKNPHRHLEPITQHWYDTPYDLFLEEPSAEYEEMGALGLYDKMFEVMPAFMLRISELGGDKDYFEDARNEDEWFYRANTLIQDNYMVQSILWSDDTSPGIKHVSGNIWNFVKAIANDPDMAGETALILALTAATGGIGGAIGGYAVLTKRLASLAKITKLAVGLNKARRLSKWTPSNIPATLLKAKGMRSFRDLIPFASKLWYVNATEGFLTGGLAEISSQETSIRFGLQEEYEGGVILEEALLEAALSPYINPMMGGLTKAGQWGAGLTTQLGISTARKIGGGKIKLPQNLKEGMQAAVHIFRSTDTKADILEIEIMSNIAISRLEVGLNALDGTIDADATMEILELVVESGETLTPQDADLAAEIVSHALEYNIKNPDNPLPPHAIVATIAQAINKNLDAATVREIIISQKHGEALRKKRQELEETTGQKLSFAEVKERAITTNPEWLVEDSDVVARAEGHPDWEEANWETKVDILDDASRDIGGLFAPDHILEGFTLVQETKKVLLDSLLQHHIDSSEHIIPLRVALGDTTVQLPSKHDQQLVEQLTEVSVETEAVTVEAQSTPELQELKDGVVENKTNPAPEVLLTNINHALKQGLITDVQARMLIKLAEKVSRGEMTLPEFNSYIETNINSDAVITESPIRYWLSSAWKLSKAGVEFNNRLTGDKSKAPSEAAPTKSTLDIVTETNPKDISSQEALDTLNQAREKAGLDLIPVENTSINEDVPVTNLGDIKDPKVEEATKKFDVAVEEIGMAVRQEIEGATEEAKNIDKDTKALQDKVNKKPVVKEEKEIAKDIVETEKAVKTLEKDDGKTFNNSVTDLEKASSTIVLNEDGTAYIDTESGTQYDRVTDVVNPPIGEATDFALQNGATIGTNLDTIARDIIAGETKPYGEYSTEDGTPFIDTEDNFNTFVEEIEAFHKTIKDEGKRVLAKDIVVHSDTEHIAGTVDLLVIDDATNTVEIIDIKTKKTFDHIDRPFDAQSIPDKEKWSNQLNTYRALIQQQYGLDVTKLSVLPILVKYPNDSPTSTTMRADVSGVIDIKILPMVARLDGKPIVATRRKDPKAEAVEVVEKQAKKYKVKPSTKRDTASKQGDAVVKRQKKRARKVQAKVNDVKQATMPEIRNLQDRVKRNQAKTTKLKAQDAVALARSHVGNFVTIQDIKDLRMIRQQQKQELERTQIVWDAFWESNDEAALKDLYELMGSRSLIDSIVKKHGKDKPYTQEQLLPFFLQYMTKLETYLKQLSVRHIMLTRGQMHNLNETMKDSGVKLITKITTDFKPKLITTPEQRKQKIANGEFDAVEAMNLSSLSNYLSRWANRLDFVISRTILTEDGNIPYTILKLSLPTGISFINIDETFKNEKSEKLNRRKNPFDDIESFVYNAEDVVTRVLELLTQTSEITRSKLETVADRVYESMTDPTDPNSEYSIFLARDIASALLDASSVLDAAKFTANKLEHGNGFKKKMGEDIIFVSDDIFLDSVHESAMERYNALETKEQKTVQDSLRLSTGTKGKIELADLRTKLEDRFQDIDIASMGDGSQGYRTSQDLGADLIDRVAGKKPGISYKRVRKDDMDIEKDVSLAELGQLYTPEFKESKEESTMILVPTKGDITAFSPLHDHQLMKVLEDQLFRNRLQFAYGLDITPDILKRWNEKEGNRKSAFANSLDRRATERPAPFISNRTFKAKLLTHSQYRDAMYEILLDFPQILARFIHDAAYSGNSMLGQFAKGTKRYPAKDTDTGVVLSTGAPTAVPLSNLGWLTTMVRLLPELKAGGFNENFLGIVLRQGLAIESKFADPNDALNQYNYDDQTFQGLHLFALLGLEEAELFKYTQELADESNWEVDLEDRYITSGSFIAFTALHSENNMSVENMKKGTLNKFVQLFKAAGLQADLTLEETQANIAALKEQDARKFDTIRELFKIGPLRTLYGGGLNAWNNFARTDKAAKILSDLNREFGTDITSQDLADFGEALYNAYVYDNTNLMRHSMDYVPKKINKVLAKYSIDKDSVQGKEIQRARTQAHKKHIRELEKRFGETTEEEVPRAVASQLMVLSQLTAAIQDIANRRGNVKAVTARFEGVVGDYLAFEKSVRDQGREYFSEDEYMEAQRIIAGVHSRGMPWKDVEYLRLLNTASKVAVGMNLDHLKIQAERLGLPYDESFLLNMQNHPLFHTHMPSASSVGRPTPVEVDIWNTHEHNMDASKIATEHWDKPSMVLLDEYMSEGLSREAAISRIYAEGKAPFGMWGLQHNSLHAAKKDFGPVDKYGDFINKKDHAKWREWSEFELDKLIMRDEMVHAATYGPIDLAEYGGEIMVNGEAQQIMNEDNKEELILDLATRWQKDSEQGAKDHQKQIELVNNLQRISRNTSLSQDERNDALTQLEWIDKTYGIEIDQLADIDIASTQGLSRNLKEYGRMPYRITADGSKKPIGMRTSNPAGYASMRPLTARVPWENIGNLALRKDYYNEKVQNLTNRVNIVKGFDMEPATHMDEVLTPNMQQDVSLYGKKKQVYFFEVGDTIENVMDPKRIPSERTARVLENILEPLALEIDFDLTNKEGYADLYYLNEMDRLLGFIESDVSSPDERYEWSFLDELSRNIVSSDSATVLQHNQQMARIALGSLIKDLHRTETAVLEREASTIAIQGEGAPVGSLVPEEGTTYESALRDRSLFGGLTRLGERLRFGIVTDEGVQIRILDKDHKDITHLDAGLLNRITKDQPLFIQSFDGMLLYYALYDNTEFDAYLKKKDKKMWDAYKSGLYTEFSNKYSLEALHKVLTEFIEKSSMDSLSNEQILIEAHIDTKTGKTEFVRIDGKIQVTKSPLGTGLIQTSRTTVGPNVYIALTPEALFAALNNNRNHPILEAMEQAYRQGVTYNPDMESAPSSRLKQDFGYNQRELRLKAIVIQESLSILAAEHKKKMDTFRGERKVEGVFPRYMNAKGYLNKTIEISLTPGGQKIPVPLWEASFLLPIQKLMIRLNHYGQSELNVAIEALADPELSEQRNILGFMLRHPTITIAQLEVVLPKSENMEVNYLEAEKLFEKINKILQWREFSPSIAHLHRNNHPEGGWRSRVNPITMLTRSWVENSDFLDKISKHKALKEMTQKEIFGDNLLPYVQDAWNNMRQNYLRHRENGRAVHQELVDFIDTNLETIVALEFADMLTTYDEAGFQNRQGVIIQEDVDSEYVERPSLNPAEVKRFSDENTLLDEFGNKPAILKNLQRLLPQVKKLPMTPESHNIIRATLGWWAKTQPSFLNDLNFSTQNLKGARIAFAEKWGDSTDISQDALYAADVPSSKLANILLLNGVAKETIESMPEFTDLAWDSKNAVVGVDIETNLLGDRFVTAVIIKDHTNPDNDLYLSADTLAGLTKAQALDILNRLHNLQQEGKKVWAHNGNTFDFPTLGRVAGNEQLAKQIALRAFDSQAIFESNLNEEPWFKLEELSNKVLGSEKAEARGGRWSYLLWRRSLGQEITINDLRLDKGKTLPTEWLQDANAIDPTEAARLLKEYTVQDGKLTADLGKALIDRKGDTVNNVIYNKPLARGLTIDTLILDAKPSWQLSEGDLSLHSSITKNFTFNTKVAETGKFQEPGYQVVVDTDKIANSDTMSAVEIIFHELMEIGQMKYIKDNSVEFENLMRLVQEDGNQNLIKQIVIALDGGKPNVNTAAKLEYILDKENPREAVAQLGAYILQRRVLGSVDTTDIDASLEKSKELIGSLKEYIKSIMEFITTQMRKVTNIFLAYRTNNTAAYDELMVTMDQIFGLNPDKTVIKDVNNAPTGPRYVEEFVTATPESDTVISDAEFSVLLIKKGRKVEAIFQAQKGNNETLVKDLLEDLAQIETDITNNSFILPGDVKIDGQISAGFNLFGLTREQVVTKRTEINEGNRSELDIRNKRVPVLNARNILHQELAKENVDYETIGLLATDLLDNLITHFGGRMTEGVGGMLALGWDKVGLTRASNVLRTFLTGFTGAEKTKYSPFVLGEILANVLIDGATHTASRVNPDPKLGTPSAQKARIHTTTFETMIQSAQIALDRALIESEGAAWNALNKEEKANKQEKLKLDTSKVLAGGDPDLTGYTKSITDLIDEMNKEWQWLRTEVFALSEGTNRLTMEEDAGIYPIRLREDGNIGNSTLLEPLMQIMNNKISNNTSDICTPVLYTAGLLPNVESAKTLADDLKVMRDPKNYPGYYEKIVKKAYRHYSRKGSSLATFQQLAQQTNLTAEVHSAFSTYVQKQLGTFNGKGKMPIWADLAKGLDADEVHAIKARYNTAIDPSSELSDLHKNRLNSLLRTTWDSTIPTTWLDNRKVGTSQQFDSIVSFLSSNILGIVGHRPFFVQNDTWLPSVIELLNNEQAVGAMEIDPNLVGRSIARTVGQSAAEVAMFAEITGTDLDVGEMLQVFKLATDPAKALNLTDGKGNLLTDTERGELHQTVKILEDKYRTLRGVAGSLITGDDATLLKTAEGSMWAIKIIYGSNLASATALVEGSMASLFYVMGQDPLRGILLPTLAYLKPLLKKNRKALREISHDMHYIHQLQSGAISNHYNAGETDTSGTHLVGTKTGKASSNKLMRFVQGWGVNSVKHAQYVAAEIKMGLDILARTNLRRKLHSTKDGISSWERIAKLLESEDIAASIEETASSRWLNKKGKRTASYLVWQKIAKRSGWGKDWKLAQSLTRNGVMTPEAIKAVQEMDTGSREMFDHNEKYLDLYKMRRWVRDSVKDPKKRRVYIEAWKGIRTAMEEQINEIMVSPNVLDMNTATHGMALLVAQYRSYPMLYTNKLFRDSARLDPKIFVIKLLTQLILDMTYTMVTMVGGGYLLEDLEEDVSTPLGFANLSLLLATRLPLFGFWGMVAFELMSLLKYGRGGVLTPIGMQGVFKWLNSVAGTIQGAGKELIPGGESWDHDDTKDFINSLRVLRIFGELAPRAVLHNILRDGQFKGSTARYGSGKTRMPFQRANPNYEMSPHVLAEAWLRDVAPDLWDKAPTWMDERQQQATIQEYLPDIPQEEQAMEEEPEGMIEEQAPAEPRSMSDPPQISGGYLEAPQGI